MILATWLVCLVPLPLLATHTAYFISNIMRCACSGTTYGSLFISSLFSIMKCDNAIPVVHDTLY